MEMILWAMGGGFAGTLMLMFYMFHKLDNRIDRLSNRIDKLSDKVDDVDRRICRIEGALATQGHCLFSQSKQDRKTE